MCFFFVAVDRLATGLRRVTVLRTAGRRRATRARDAGRLVVVLRLGGAFLTRAVDRLIGFLAATRRTVGRFLVMAVERLTVRRTAVGRFLTIEVDLRTGRLATVFLTVVLFFGAALRAAGL